MSKMKFIENVGSCSTTAHLGTKKLGHDVNAAAYECDGKIVIKLESNGVPVKGVNHIEMTREQYDEFCLPQARKLFVRGIELFGASSIFGE